MQSEGIERDRIAQTEMTARRSARTVDAYTAAAAPEAPYAGLKGSLCLPLDRLIALGKKQDRR